MTVAAVYTADGGLVSTAIDWRSVDIVLGVGRDVGLELINLIVWSKFGRGPGVAVAECARAVSGLQEGRRHRM